MKNKRGAASLVVIVLLIIGAVYFLNNSGNKPTANIIQDQNDNTGDISVKLHDGYSNTTATEDFLNDDENVMDIYSADANIADGEEYKFNITVERTKVAYADTIDVVCSIADKEISGVTADNLAEKTSGKIDLDINNEGTFLDENTVKKTISFTAGDPDVEVEVAFDQEETYHDGMTDMQDSVDVICKISDGDQTKTTTTTIKAKS